MSGTRYTIELPAGIYDLLAMDVDQPLAPIFLRRNLEVSAAGTADVDFDGAGVIRPRPRAFTAPAGTPGEGLVATVLFRSGNGAWIVFSGSSAAEIPAIGASDLLPGDTQELSVTGYGLDSSRDTRKVLDGTEALPALSLPPAFDSLELILPPASSGGTWRPHARFAPYPTPSFIR